MMIYNNMLRKNENGATAVYAAVVLAMLLMFAALSIDVNYLYGVRNELHNAADAGSLAGASTLFKSDGTLNRQGAIDEATRIASSNKTGSQDVVEITAQTGHWSFASKTFTANENTTQTNWQERSFGELDLDTDFINAVRVYTARSDTPSFFAKILGFDQFFVSTDAVAYIGFAGTLYPAELDQPIAICEDSILDPETKQYNCNMGRMLNSGGNPATSMTAMWTNFTQDPCSTANNSDMADLTDDCDATNPNTVTFGEGMGTQNGVQDNILGNVTDCWEAYADSDGDGKPDRFWPLMLPVIRCGIDNTCSPLVGAVEVNVVWIQYKNDPWTQMNEVPTVMEDWSCTTTDTLAARQECWKDFVDHFNLQNANGDPLTDEEYEEMYQKKNIFFLPSCEDHKPTGGTGGANYGVLARIPVLVE